jgi:hypothetical protein
MSSHATGRTWVVCKMKFRRDVIVLLGKENQRIYFAAVCKGVLKPSLPKKGRDIVL